MTDPFKKYGINHLSPSSLNCWRETPGLWCLRYLAKIRDSGNASMWRGTATEKGVEAMLRGKSPTYCLEIALADFDKLCVGELSDEITKERANIEPMIAQAEKASNAHNLHDLAATQIRVETFLDGVSIPVMGYVDFTFMQGPDVDLKTTKQCPSAPRLAHVRQVSLYNKARNRPAALLYVTDKKSAYFEISPEDMRDAVDELTMAGQSLERFLALMPDARSAMRALPHVFEHYAYSDATRAKVRQLDRDPENASGFEAQPAPALAWEIDEMTLEDLL